MFTGLVQAQGIVESINATQLRVKLHHAPETILSDLAIGDSVAVDGVCLTVETILAAGFVATVSPETVQRTCLGQRATERLWVNLEPSLRVGSKIGGHFVTGHVDGVGTLVDAHRTQTSWELTFGATTEQRAQWEAAIAPYPAPKGSVTVNGISLTIADCDRAGHQFTIAVIPHTYAATNLAQLKPGSWVNIEGDILSKYVERLLSRQTIAPNSIDLAFLNEHGYV
jgi:riboflavin synthase